MDTISINGLLLFIDDDNKMMDVTLNNTRN